MKLRLAAALCLLASPGVLSAKEIQADSTLVAQFDGASIAEAFAALDATTEPATLSNGTKGIHFEFQKGLGGIAVPANCKDQEALTGCTGLALTAIYSKPAVLPAGGIAALANEFNKNHVAVQVNYDADGSSRLNMYIIGDYGITKTNLIIQLFNFRQSAMAYSQAVFPNSPG